LIQMKSETLDRINTALRRISEGTYGICLECGDEVAEPRISLERCPLRCGARTARKAVRVAERHERMTARRNPLSLYSEVSTSA
jgi:RNA polymerase-binding transcription factor DksA